MSALVHVLAGMASTADDEDLVTMLGVIVGALRTRLSPGDLKRVLKLAYKASKARP